MQLRLVSRNVIGGFVMAMSCGWQAPPGGTFIANSSRVIKKEVTVSASIENVWDAWTTPAGIESFFARRAFIEITPGGKFELWFKPDAPEGSRGCEGCEVLSFLPQRMLAFSWNATPAMPSLRDAHARTQVVLRFAEVVGGEVHVTLEQLGIGEGEAWDEYYTYFDRAWGNVLAAFKKHIESGDNASTSRSKMKVFVATGKSGPKWADGLRMTQQEGFADHFAYFKREMDKDVFIAAGLFADFRSGMTLLRARSLDEARELVTNDPFVKDELLTVDVNEWTVALTSLPVPPDQLFRDATWAKCGDGTERRETWMDGLTKVTAIYGPLKRQEFEIELPVSVEKVWGYLATKEGMREIFDPQSDVELKPGGIYRDWSGVKGKILAYVPHEMLSGTGSAPKKFPTVRKGGTWWVYRFDAIDAKRMRLTMTLLGWHEHDGKEWDEAFDYFLVNNPIYLNETLYAKIVGKPGMGKHGYTLRHEAIVDAPVDEVWRLFTTKEGAESWMVAHAQFDLRPGGMMLTNYHADGYIGDENTIGNTILSFEPLRMLSLKANKPPVNFPYADAIKDVWTVMRFDPVSQNKTRVVVTGYGYRSDEESREMRKFFARGNAWTLAQLKKRCADELEARKLPSDLELGAKKIEAGE